MRYVVKVVWVASEVGRVGRFRHLSLLARWMQATIFITTCKAVNGNSRILSK